MSNPIKKLEQMCNIIGDKCDILVDNRNKKAIDDTTFINEYFNMVNDMPDGTKKDKVISELESYKINQSEISYRDEPFESGE